MMKDKLIIWLGATFAVSVLKAQPGDFIQSINEGYYRGNPIIEGVFTADPCPLVYHDTLFLFTGHDEQNTVNKWFYMIKAYVGDNVIIEKVIVY